MSNCELCNKTYKSQSGLWKHNKTKHNNKEKEIVTSIQETISENSFNCRKCDKILSNRKSRWRHEKNCNETNNYKEMYLELAKEVREIKDNMKKPTKQIYNFNANIGNTLNTINLCPVGNEDIKLLTVTEAQEILDNGMNCIIKLAKHLNFNERLPQNHVFASSAINGKHINVVDPETNMIIKVSKKNFFDSTIGPYLKKLESIPSLKLKLNNLKNYKNNLEILKSFIYDKKGREEYINQINTLSYNNRHTIMKTWQQLKENNQLGFTPLAIEHDKDIDPKLKEFEEQISKIQHSDSNNYYETYDNNNSNSDSSNTTDENMMSNNSKMLSYFYNYKNKK